MPKNFESLIGANFRLYGVDGNCVKLENEVWEAVEDENDGYRSMLRVIQLHSGEGLIFQQRAFARVTIKRVDDKYGLDGFQVVDLSDGHVWVEIGTSNSDDYYPSFVFRYHAKTKIEPLPDPRSKFEFLNGDTIH